MQCLGGGTAAPTLGGIIVGGADVRNIGVIAAATGAFGAIDMAAHTVPPMLPPKHAIRVCAPARMPAHDIRVCGAVLGCGLGGM